MRVIITGGSGLIGRALTGRLAAAGHQVVILSRDPSRVHGLPSGAQAVQWDARTGQGWDNLVEDAAIVNLAGESLSLRRWTTDVKDRIRNSRLDAGSAVVQAVKSSGRRPRVLMQASAVGYYASRGDEELREDSPPGGDFLARVCVAWEASTSEVEALGVRRVIIRSAPVLSAKGGVLPSMMMPFRFFVGGKLGSGRQWFPWIHIDDEVAAISSLIENDEARGSYNLAAPHVVTNAEFSSALGRAMGRPSVIPVPALALHLGLGELGGVLLTSQRVAPQRLLDQGFSFRFRDVEGALRDLVK